MPVEPMFDAVVVTVVVTTFVVVKMTVVVEVGPTLGVTACFWGIPAAKESTRTTTNTNAGDDFRSKQVRRVPPL